MRISCCAYSYRDRLRAETMSLFQFIETAREIGFDGVELTSYYFPSTTRDYLNDLKRRIHRNGLLVSGTAVGTDFAQTDAEKREAHVQMTYDWLEQSVVLGAPTLRVFAGTVPQGSSEAEAFERVGEALRRCAARARECGVLLALENHGGLTETAEGTLRLLDAVESDWIGLNLDFGNFRGDPYEDFARCAPRAVATHAKSHFNGVSGRQKVDYERVRDILDVAGYRGYVAIEYEEAEDPETAVPAFAGELFRAFRHFRSAFTDAG
jgi:sugar phosphate isomerase/epimerase